MRSPSDFRGKREEQELELADMAAATPLTAAQKAALKAEFGKVFNGQGL